MVGVSWDDAQDYIAWLNRVTDGGYRLPSEAEWEYAYRAATTTPFYTGNCITTREANYNGNWDYNGCGANTMVYLQEIQPVDSYPANPWKLCDMAGNVWEWVEDCWHGNYQSAPTDGSVWAGGDCSRRVLRGGSWANGPRVVRAAYRYWASPADRSGSVGLRLARRSK